MISMFICTQPPNWNFRNNIKIPQVVTLLLNISNRNRNHPPYPVWNNENLCRAQIDIILPAKLFGFCRTLMPNEASLGVAAWQANLRWLAGLDSPTHGPYGPMLCHWSPNLCRSPSQTSNLGPSLLKAGIRIQTHQIRNQHAINAIFDSVSDNGPVWFRSRELSHQQGWFNCGHVSSEVTWLGVWLLFLLLLHWAACSRLQSDNRKNKMSGSSCNDVFLWTFRLASEHGVVSDTHQMIIRKEPARLQKNCYRFNICILLHLCISALQFSTGNNSSRPLWFSDGPNNQRFYDTLRNKTRLPESYIVKRPGCMFPPLPKKHNIKWAFLETPTSMMTDSKTVAQLPMISRIS